MYSIYLNITNIVEYDENIWLPIIFNGVKMWRSTEQKWHFHSVLVVVEITPVVPDDARIVHLRNWSPVTTVCTTHIPTVSENDDEYQENLAKV